MIPNMRSEIIEFMVPSGEYFIGDPGYAFEEKEWKNICQIDKNDRVQKIIYSWQGKNFFMVSVGGDGDFIDTQGFTYSVETGSLGLVPIDLISPNLIKDCKGPGRFVVFKEATLCRSLDEKFLMLGTVVFCFNTEIDVDYEKDIVGRNFWEIWK